MILVRVEMCEVDEITAASLRVPAETGLLTANRVTGTYSPLRPIVRVLSDMT